MGYYSDYKKQLELTSESFVKLGQKLKTSSVFSQY